MTVRKAALLPLGLLALGASGSAARPSAPAPGSTQVIALPLELVIAEPQRRCGAKTPSGLGYAVLKSGAGPQPGATDHVLVNYIGFIAATGKVFDQGMATPLTVDGVIPGFGEALQRMQRGSIQRFCIPAALGYGRDGAGPIPPNADLVFQIEVLDFRTAAEIAAMRAAQQAPAEAAVSPQP